MTVDTSHRFPCAAAAARSSHDRVFRFLPSFACREDALGYALAQATIACPAEAGPTISTGEKIGQKDLIEMQGKVDEVLPDSRYRVTLDNGHTLVAYSAGKMRKHHIRILAGDKVSLELSPRPDQGRITFQHIERSSAPGRLPSSHFSLRLDAAATPHETSFPSRHRLPQRSGRPHS